MIVGIDLGTTHSLISVWQDGKAVLIPNSMGEFLTPSVVGLDDNGEIIVGAPAKERLYTNPDVSVACFKRYMGSHRAVRMGDQRFKPQELSAFVLKHLKADAEAFLGHPITEAVISVPAYFNDIQRKATKSAGQIAGLTVDRLINEPTAAALAYGLNNKEEAQLLIFDLGGGTFDVSILDLFDGVMEITASAGDNALGGEDFTEQLSKYIVSTFPKGLYSQEHIDSVIHKINIEAERCKKGLSARPEFEFKIDAEGLTHSLLVTREKFKEVAQPILDRIKQPVKNAMRDSNIKPNEIDSVILVGGASRMPMVTKLVTQMFGKLPERRLDPDTVVALGAAVQGALIEQHKELEEVVLTDVCPFSLGIEVSNEVSAGQYKTGGFHPIIERNSSIPSSKVDRFYTMRNNQKHIDLNIYQGESREVKDNILLGHVSVAVPVDTGQEQAVDVRFSYDTNGMLDVDATVVSTGVAISVLIKNDNMISEEEIAASRERLQALKFHPRENTVNLALIYKGNRLFEQLLGEAREKVGFFLDQYLAALDSQDDNVIRKARKVFRDQLSLFKD